MSTFLGLRQMDADRRRDLLRITGAVAALLAIGTAVVLLVGPREEELTRAVEGFGAAAPVAGIVVYAVLSSLVVPGSILSIAAGVMFGPLMGTLVAVAGGFIGAMVSFYVARFVFHERVQRLSGERLSRLDEWVADYGVLAFAYVRIIPAMPYSVVNFAAGASSVRTRDYALGSALGLVPGGFAYAAFGGTVMDPTSPEFAAAVALLVAVLVAGFVAQRRLGPNSE
jgi:uncharacterized membrane protein YdjX (TVP38/TMEM64 family)